MDRNNIIALRPSSERTEDALTEVLRQGARKLLMEAVEAEIDMFLERYKECKTDAGHAQVVRNGYLPEREIQTGIGSIPVKVPRTRDRNGSGIAFRSLLLPPYLKRTKSLEEVLPWLYLKGISTGDFSEALAALLGPQASGLSASTIVRLKEGWQEEHEAWQKCSLKGKHYVYFWVDGVYLQARMEEDRQCVLVIIGADEKGKKELVGLYDGVRESEQSWKELLLDLKQRGLEKPPQLAIGDGALGFWKALLQVYGETQRQRCWVHKTLNVLNKVPSSIQAKVKQHLQNIWMAETKEDAEKAFIYFLSAYRAKYPKAVECLEKDYDDLLTFYDFPAEHWIHIRTTNPIESTFATVRLRTHKTKGCLSRSTGLAMVFKLMQAAEKKWRRLTGAQRMAEIITGVKFKDGIAVNSNEKIQTKIAA
jgi:putative transposase